MGYAPMASKQDQQEPRQLPQKQPSRVFQFGIGAAYCTSDPTRDLKEALTKAPKGNPRPALTDPDDVGELMRRIEVYDAKNGGLVRYALKLIALTMVRPGELRLAEWTEFDEANRVWLIPAEKMKMRDDHAVAAGPRHPRGA